jgi:hypothetical protein
VTLAQDAHGTWPDKGETAAVISERANRTLAQAGARLRSTQDIVRSFPA